MTMECTVRLENRGRLRREYLDKEETRDAPLPRADWRQDRDGFSFDGHRLSSLYRDNKQTRTRLTDRFKALSLCFFFEEILKSSLCRWHPEEGVIA